MSTLALIVLFTTLGGALSALAASVVLFLPAGARASLLPRLVSFATGTLLGAAFMVLLPHALVDEASPGPHAVGAAMLAGILCFFLLEKFVLWRHCHDDPCEMHSPGEASRDAASARLVLIGDSFHNVLDGVLIAAAFMTDHALGIVTAIAVFSHEIPQEVGDLAILMHGGLTRLRALVLNLLTSLSSVLGGVIAYFALASALEYLPVCAGLRRGELPVRRRGRPDSRPAPAHRPSRRRRAGPVHRSRRRGGVVHARPDPLRRGGGWREAVGGSCRSRRDGGRRHL